MSLILTELSEAGIAMAADSAITFLNKDTGTYEKQQMWTKLFKVPRAKAGVSYWGAIGLIDHPFDSWLRHQIANGDYNDVQTFAEFIERELNNAAGSRLIKANQAAGVHVAGIQIWKDGVSRPVFYHVHNGHLTSNVAVEYPEGSVCDISSSMVTEDFISPSGQQQIPQIDPILLAVNRQGAVLRYETVAESRKMFKAYHDFTPMSKSADQASTQLKTGYLTRNGDYVPYTLVASAMNMANAALSSIPTLASAHDATKIGPRVGRLYYQLKAVIQGYRANTMPRIIDGEVMTLGIRNDGTYLDDKEFRNSEWLETPPMTPR